jgi:proteasome accessory factor A
MTDGAEVPMLHPEEPGRSSGDAHRRWVHMGWLFAPGCAAPSPTIPAGVGAASATSAGSRVVSDADGDRDPRIDPTTGLRRRIFGTEVEYGVGTGFWRPPNPEAVGTEIVRTLTGEGTDAFLGNGARFYRDVGDHPEYSTPECSTILDAVTWDAAGERILDGARAAALARLRLSDQRADLRVYKNNVDAAGHTYGAHENYLVDRQIETDGLYHALIPFLVSRIVFTGAGQVVPRCVRRLGGRAGATFVVSPRAHHLEAVIGETTTQKRALVNTRDEAHADKERFRRLHLICGDATMSSYATYLKLGTTALALRILETEPDLWPRIDLPDPLMAMQRWSADPELRRRVRLGDGRQPTAVQLQARYLEAALEFGHRHRLPDDEARALAMWEETVSDLLDDPERCHDRIDWIAKWRLVRAFGDRHGIPHDDDRLVEIDLRYHDVDPSRSLARLLEQRGSLRRIVDTAAVERAVHEPPAGTRAVLRAAFIRRAQGLRANYRAGWTSLSTADRYNSPLRTVSVPDPFRVSCEEIDRLAGELTSRPSLVTASRR